MINPCLTARNVVTQRIKFIQSAMDSELKPIIQKNGTKSLSNYFSVEIFCTSGPWMRLMMMLPLSTILSTS